MLTDAAFQLHAQDWLVLRMGHRAIAYGQSANLHCGDDIALHLTVTAAGVVILNRTRAGAWQAERRIQLPRPPEGPLGLALRFHPGGFGLIQLGTDGFACQIEWGDLLDRPLRLVAGDLVAHWRFAAPAQPQFPPPHVEGAVLFPDNLLLVHGWHHPTWSATPGHAASVETAAGALTLPVETIWHETPAPDGQGLGFVLGLQLPGEGGVLAAPRAITLADPLSPIRLVLPDPADWQRGEAAGHGIHRLLAQHPHSAPGPITAVLTKPVYTGVDTLAALPSPCHFGLDQLQYFNGHGLMLAGWMLDPEQAVAALRIGPDATGGMVALDLAQVSLERPDVQAAFADRHPLADADCGFLTLCPLSFDPGAATDLHIEIELKTGERGYLPLPPPQPAGFDTIPALLGGLPLQGAQVARAFDKVLAAPLLMLNRERLDSAAAPEELRFGTGPAQPRCSIVVPLYGRMDFIEYQCALLSRATPFPDELIFVLDEPERRDEVLALLDSCHARYGMAMRLLLPDANRGFAAASNLGLQYATGSHVCFLNSDIFPQGADWLDRLIAAIAADPGIGAIGATCVFADGAIQHIGMQFEADPALGGWCFPRHPGKGLRADGGAGSMMHRPEPAVTDWPAITGACMVMRRDLAEELGGFDTDYVIGDFEDADLCNRIRARGLRCAVLPSVRLYHLERQSLGRDAPLWRWNLTLLNAWTFNRRWP